MKPFNKIFSVGVLNKVFMWRSQHHKALWNDSLKKLEGKNVWITLSTKEPTRTLKQNALLWLYYGIIAEETGHTNEEIHSWAKGKFLSQGITEIYGDKVRRIKSTTELSKNEFAEYLLQIESETGIPVPDVQAWNDYKDSAPMHNENKS